MEMTLNLTFEDGLRVAEAMRDTAIKNGWDAEELADCDVIEEYARVVDAALTAMGINISIDGTPSCEDEDFDDEDEEEEEEENPPSDTVIMAGMLAGALDSREWDTDDPEEMKMLVETVLSATSRFKKEVLGE